MKAKKLSELEIEEISLVDVPATRMVWKIVKNKNGESFDKKQDDSRNKKEVNKMDELIKIFKDINGLEEISKEQKEAFEALSEEDIKKYSVALEVLKKYKDELPEDLNKELSVLAKFGVRETKKVVKETDEEVEKTGKKLSKDTLNTIQSAVKQLGGLTDTLSNLLPKEDTEKMAAEKKKAEEVDEKIKKGISEAKEEMDKESAKKDETIEELKKKVSTLEETKSGKKSLEEENTDNEDESKHIKKDGTFEWTFMNKE